jgi:hypothetical protein
MARGTSRNRVHNGVRTRFLDQVSIAAFQPADLITQEAANYLALKNTFYGDKTTQSGSGTTYDDGGRIDGESQVIFRNVATASVPTAITDPGLGAYDVYINGLFLEKSAFKDGYPKNEGNDVILVINNASASLENNLDQFDLLTISGKLNSVS